MEQMVKIDDADWHEQDAANRIQAGIHIALVYFWLYENKFIDKDMPDNWQAVIRERQKSPGGVFEQWSDGKLVVDKRSSDPVLFLEDFYNEVYLQHIQDQTIPNMQYDERYSLPYNIKDIWENVDTAGSFLDRAFREWRKGR